MSSIKFPFVNIQKNKTDHYPQQFFSVASRQDGSDELKIGGYSLTNATVVVPIAHKTIRLRLGVEWDGKTVPVQDFLVWVAEDGELKMVTEREQ